LDGRNHRQRPATENKLLRKAVPPQFHPKQSPEQSTRIGQFKWIVKNTFFRFLNQGIKVEGKNTDLSAIRHQMTLAEVSHLIGFLFVAAFALFQTFNISLVFGLSMMIPNAILNAYPSLLQQENKRRIDQVLERRKSHR
jgi:hypothetical protein